MHDRSQAPLPPADLDLNALHEISGGAPEILAEIIDEYVQMATQTMSSLVAAVQRGDVAEMARLAHTLKGSSGMVGANGVMRASEAMEGAARASDRTAIGAAFAALSARHESTLAALAAARNA